MTAISQIRTPSALSITDLNTAVNLEPRVLDLTLAERLGMTDPHAIRRMIEKNRRELESHGEVSETPLESLDLSTATERGQGDLWGEECTGMCGT